METNIINEIELKYIPCNREIHSIINSPLKTYETLMHLWNPDTIGIIEEVKVLYLNRGNQLIGVYNHSKGGISGSVIDVRLIVGMALKCAASGIILAHNHPSGNLKPSIHDEDMTRKIKNCCELFEIVLLDHFIITLNGYYSFVEKGKI
jgi:DNA repair protein RadC